MRVGCVAPAPYAAGAYGFSPTTGAACSGAYAYRYAPHTPQHHGAPKLRWLCMRLRASGNCTAQQCASPAADAPRRASRRKKHTLSALPRAVTCALAACVKRVSLPRLQPRKTHESMRRKACAERVALPSLAHAPQHSTTASAAKPAVRNARRGVYMSLFGARDAFIGHPSAPGAFLACAAASFPPRGSCI